MGLGSVVTGISRFGDLFEKNKSGISMCLSFAPVIQNDESRFL